ncbi:MAG TPA: hypothetical protein VJC15_03610 [Candidatus Paceibacterota bacterium]
MKLFDQSTRTNWKFIAIVAFVAVFLAGGILMLIPQFQEPISPLRPSVISSPNENESNNQVLDTSEWQTYRSDEFEFQYPKVFDEYRGCELHDILGDKTLTLGVSISIFVKNAEGAGLEGYVDQNFSSESQFDISRKNIQVDGRNAIQIGSRTEGLGRYSEITYVLEQDKMYIFTYMARANCLSYEVFSESELSVLQQILSTLRFVD